MYIRVLQKRTGLVLLKCPLVYRRPRCMPVIGLGDWYGYYVDYYLAEPLILGAHLDGCQLCCRGVQRGDVDLWLAETRLSFGPPG